MTDEVDPRFRPAKQRGRRAARTRDRARRAAEAGEVLPPWETDTPGSWRAYVFTRDHRRCVACGYHGEHLTAHHLIFKSHCAHAYKYDGRNGITLCGSFAPNACHDQLHAGSLKIRKSWLPSSVIECLAEQGLVWTETGPTGVLSVYFQ